MKKSIALLATATWLMLPGSSLAETGGAGLLAEGEKPPATFYEPAIEARSGLRLLRPRSPVAHNTDGEAGLPRFYGGVRFSAASRRIGVRKVRVALHSSSGKLLSHIDVTNPGGRRWRYVFLDRLGVDPAATGAGSGQDYSIRYTMFNAKTGKNSKRIFTFSVPSAS